MDNGGFAPALIGLAGLVFAGVLGSWISMQKGRDSTEGLALGCLLGPIGWIIAALLPNQRSQADEAPRKRCPSCGERVAIEARVCAHCHFPFRGGGPLMPFVPASGSLAPGATTETLSMQPASIVGSLLPPGSWAPTQPPPVAKYGYQVLADVPGLGLTTGEVVLSRTLLGHLQLTPAGGRSVAVKGDAWHWAGAPEQPGIYVLALHGAPTGLLRYLGPVA